MKCAIEHTKRGKASEPYELADAVFKLPMRHYRRTIQTSLLDSRLFQIKFYNAANEIKYKKCVQWCINIKLVIKFVNLQKIIRDKNVDIADNLNIHRQIQSDNWDMAVAWNEQWAWS